MIKVLLVDDKELFRTALKSFLNLDPEIEIVATAENGQVALEILKTVVPDIMLLDIEMPILNGLRTLIELRKFNQTIGVIILSMHYEIELVNEFRKFGANGFVTKDHSSETLTKAIYTVNDGGEYFEKVVKKDSTKDSIINAIKVKFKISEREFEILTCVCNGLMDKEISDTLCIAERTVETHKTNLFKKIGVSSKMELIIFAINAGLVCKNIMPKDL